MKNLESNLTSHYGFLNLSTQSDCVDKFLVLFDAKKKNYQVNENLLFQIQGNWEFCSLVHTIIHRYIVAHFAEGLNEKVRTKMVELIQIAQ